MKLRLTTVLLSLGGLLVCGCSRNAPGAALATALVQEGKTVTWPDGRKIHVQRRQVNNLEGIRFVQGSLGGPQRTVEAERGLISRDPDGKTVRVTLYGAVVREGGRDGASLVEFSVICPD